MPPSREIFWNIQYSEIVYFLGVIVVAVMVYAFYRRYRMWHIGKPDPRLPGPLSKRVKAFLKTGLIDGILHRKFFGVADNLGHRPLRFRDMKPREWYPGISHFLIFAGCFLLLFGTFLDILSHYLVPFLEGNFYLAHSLFVDIGGIMALFGALMAVFRRYVQKPERLDNKSGDLIALLAIILVILTGYVVEGFRIAADEIKIHPGWSVWSPGGYILAKTFGDISQSSLLIWHRTWWWLHMVLTMGTIAYIALYFNRLWHIIVSPWNVFFRNLGPRGMMTTIDLEKAESFGVSHIQDFTWKDMLDWDACTRCGRCTDNCPAHLSGKPLNPKKVLQDLKGRWQEEAPAILRNKVEKKEEQTENPGAAEKQSIIGMVISTDEIWNCTTCFACQEVCPVWAEPMGKLSEMRRNLVLEQATIPETAEGALRSIEDRGHPWRGTLLTRTDWAEGMDVKVLADNSNVDYLFWVGCTEALEDRSVKVARAIAGILQKSGVNFGILGQEESCCGDPARRMGNEYLYQIQAQKNIELMETYNVKKIITGCPHCYNTLKNEYPQFGGEFEVIHHTEFILGLLREGKLGDIKGYKETVAYHDACYLGRYNNIFETPRDILKTIPGINLVEMDRSRERSFCCGAGGGHLWLEEQKEGERINVMRTEQVMAVKAGIIATACPYCLQMFQDGIKTRSVEESVKVMDIAEIVNPPDK
jgi:Fe-S oxidoreductase/nitrate reductase gamma subunit